ncbi:MAG: hypothetical protein IT367_21260, partial [Candidatus Hydrogenedentes bacterium]|nr:hypothetical protein [Candidatus Hydrogenedentota bacterium]
ILYADPWIRRCDDPSSINSMYSQAHQQRQKSIQYETRLYCHSLSSASDEHISQQQRQPLINNIDKDIEYVESRLRGQTTISLPPPRHSANCTNDSNWRQISKQNCVDPLVSSSNDKQQSVHIANQTCPSTMSTQKRNEVNAATSKPSTQKLTTSISTSTHGSVKTVKNRLEKMKDQKAAKTLR